MILVFWKLSFKPTFWFSSFTLIHRLFSSSSHSAIRVVSSAYLKLLLFFIFFCPLLLLLHFSLSTIIFSFPYFPLFSSYEITVRNAMFPAISVYKRCHCPQWLQPSIVSWWALRKHRAEKNTCHLAAIMDSGSWWWTGRPGVLQFMGLQRVRHDWVTELNWAAVRQQPLPMLSPEKSQDRKIQDIGTRLLRCISKE